MAPDYNIPDSEFDFDNMIAKMIDLSMSRAVASKVIKDKVMKYKAALCTKIYKIVPVLKFHYNFIKNKPCPVFKNKINVRNRLLKNLKPSSSLKNKLSEGVCCPKCLC